MNKKFLLVGGIPYPDSKYSRIGGTTVLMQNLIDYCKSNNIEYDHISTNKYYGRFSVLRNLFYTFFKSFSKINKSDIIFINISSKNGLVTLLPFYLVLSKLFNKKVVTRMFGGNLKAHLESSNVFKKLAVKSLTSSDMIVVETKAIIKYLKGYKIDAFWLPNVRNENSLVPSSINFKKRFVFISHIKESKGVDLICHVSNLLPQDYTIDLYGSIVEPKYNADYFNNFRVNYKGELRPQEVLSTLSDYDCLLFPTFWKGEGYPGIVIEALSLGLPIIASKWGGIEEIISHESNGILISPKSEEELLNAILNMNQEVANSISKTALDSFQNNFESSHVYKRLFKQIESL